LGCDATRSFRQSRGDGLVTSLVHGDVIAASSLPQQAYAGGRLLVLAPLREHARAGCHEHARVEAKALDDGGDFEDLAGHGSTEEDDAASHVSLELGYGILEGATNIPWLIPTKLEADGAWHDESP
jgi:hypothetical protein